MLNGYLSTRKCDFIVEPSVSDGGSGTSLSERGHYTESIMLNDYPKSRSVSRMCKTGVQNGFVVVPSVSDEGVQNIPAVAGLSVNDKLNELS